MLPSCDQPPSLFPESLNIPFKLRASTLISWSSWPPAWRPDPHLTPPHVRPLSSRWLWWVSAWFSSTSAGTCSPPMSPGSGWSGPDSLGGSHCNDTEFLDQCCDCGALQWFSPEKLSNWYENERDDKDVYSQMSSVHFSGWAVETMVQLYLITDVVKKKVFGLDAVWEFCFDIFLTIDKATTLS